MGTADQTGLSLVPGASLCLQLEVVMSAGWLAGTRLDPERETTSNPREDQQSVCLVLLTWKQEASRGVGLAGGRHIWLGKEPEPLRWRGWGGGGRCDSL